MPDRGHDIESLGVVGDEDVHAAGMDADFEVRCVHRRRGAEM